MYPVLVRVAVGIVCGLVAAGYIFYKSRNQENSSHRQPGHHCHTDSASQSSNEVGEFGGIYEDSKSLCCLCLEGLAMFEVFYLPCKHGIHKQCAQLLFNNQAVKSCPLCRRTIPDNLLRGSGFCV